jgi:hypothetical protein
LNEREHLGQLVLGLVAFQHHGPRQIAGFGIHLAQRRETAKIDLAVDHLAETGQVAQEQERVEAATKHVFVGREPNPIRAPGRIARWWRRAGFRFWRRVLAQRAFQLGGDRLQSLRHRRCAAFGRHERPQHVGRAQQQVHQSARHRHAPFAQPPEQVLHGMRELRHPAQSERGTAAFDGVRSAENRVQKFLALGGSFELKEARFQLGHPLGGLLEEHVAKAMDRSVHEDRLLGWCAGP